MDFDELRAFLDVVDAGSVLAAADARGVSRTTLKRRIDGLEARAGVPLLITTSRGIVVTEAGRVLAERGRQMSREMGVLVSSLRRLRHEPHGLLRVIIPVGMPPQPLVELFAALRATWPELRFDVRYSDNPLDDELDHVDLAVHLGDPPGSSWDSFVLARPELKLLAHRDYLAARGHPATLADLHEHELLVWHAPGADPGRITCADGAQYPVRPVMASTDIHWLRQCCIQRLGIAFVPDVMLPDPGVGPDELVRVLPETIGGQLPLRLSVPVILADSPKLVVVVEHARRLLDALGVGVQR